MIALYSGTVKAEASSSDAEASASAGHYFKVSGIHFEDDNSNCFKGVWNDDETVYTVTSRTADDDGHGYDLLVLNLSQIRYPDGSSFKDEELVSVVMKPQLPAGYFFNRKGWNGGMWIWSSWATPSWLLSRSPSDADSSTQKKVHDNPSILNGDYVLTFKIRHNGFDYVVKKTLRLRY